MTASLPPGLVLIVGGLLAPLLPDRPRRLFMLALPILGALHLLVLPEGPGSEVDLFGHALVLVRVDGLALAFAGVFFLAAFLNVIFGWHERDPIQHASALVYAGAAIGAVFAGDLISLFIFWELTAIASVFLIWARRTERAYRAGMRYIVIQVGSGVILLAGVVLHYRETGSLAFGELGLTGTATALIFLAFAIKCAFPLLHSWVVDAYPEATVFGTVVLSAFTTKLAVYALARGFPGTEMLIWIGAVMTVFPIFYAIIENDLRRVLAYSLVNQLGFMVIGIGIGTPLAINGAVAQAVAHVLYKALLFMSIGAVLHRMGSARATDLGGLWRSMPLTAAFCTVGAASIAAAPLFSGFATKSLLLSAAAGGGHYAAWLVMLFASACVLLYSAIRVPYFAFFGPDRGLSCEEAPRGMLVAMGLAAALCVAIGVYPEGLHRLLPHPMEYDTYTFDHVLTQLQLLAFAALAFVIFLGTGLYPANERAVNLDADWLYRRLLRGVLGLLREIVSHLHLRALLRARVRLNRFIATVYRHHGPQGALARTWPVGSTVLWVAVLLCVMLILYYI